MELKYTKLSPAAKEPVQATIGSACFDLFAINGELVRSGNSEVFKTGLSFEVPENHVMLVFSRSGHGFKRGLRLANSVGVIDSDYRGEVLVKIHNDSFMPEQVEPGSAIAQFMIVPLPTVRLLLTDKLSETERGQGGIGSTG